MRPTPTRLAPHASTVPSPTARAAAPLPHGHHLWRNGRLWWIAITLYDTAGRRHRVRRSLRTADAWEAFRARDLFLARLHRTGRWRTATPGGTSPIGTPGARSGAAA